jgi:integrase
MRRTRYQQGSLTKLKRKGGKQVWIFRWREIGPDGKRRPCKRVIGTVAEYPTKQAAEQAVEAFRIDINAGTKRAQYPKVIDFRTLTDHYIAQELPLDQREATIAKAYSTIVTNKRYLKLWIVPRWGKVKIQPNCWYPVEIEDWLRELGKDHGLANGTRAKIRNIMSAVFRHAIRHGFLPRDEYANPMKYVRQSAATDIQPVVLTEAQVVAILTCLHEPFRTLALLGATTGLRISELLGLKWVDIDFEHLEIRVQRAIVYGVVGGCKSKASRRPVPLDSRVAELLFDWRCKTEYNQPADFIFASWKTKGKKTLCDAFAARKKSAAGGACSRHHSTGWLAHVSTYRGLASRALRRGRESRTGVAAARQHPDYARHLRAGRHIGQKGSAQQAGAGAGSAGESGLIVIMYLLCTTPKRMVPGKPLKGMVARDGVEPPTPAFSGLRSTT